MTSSLREAISDAGLEAPDHIEPGRFIRFPSAGKPRSNRSAWCLLFNDGEGGVFGDWATGFSGRWQAEITQPLTASERRERRRRIRASSQKAEADQRQQHAAAAERARRILTLSGPATSDHPYLQRKHVQPHLTRVYRGLLVLPIETVRGQLTSLQFIADNGDKRMLTGGRKNGCCVWVTRQDMPRRVLITEGWATGATLAQHYTNAAVIAALDAGNLKKVAVAVRNRWRSTQIIVAGDDDRAKPENVGRKAANEAALAVNGVVMLPDWPDGAPGNLTDFNDLHCWLGGNQ